jgi:hypothetical protein
LRGSIDIDTALRTVAPNAARWDYVLGAGKQGTADSTIWLEVHPASSHHIGDVLDKLIWLKDWINNSAPDLGQLPPHFCWIATGTVSFSRSSPHARKIEQKGLRFPVKHLDIADVLSANLH